MIKLIVSDVDGTLVPPAGRSPSPELTAAFADRLASGAVIALASGRPLSGLAGLFPELEDRLIYICCNGTTIVHNRKVISVSPLAQGEDLCQLIRVFREIRCDFMVNTLDRSVAEETISDEAYRMILGSGIHLEIVHDILDLASPVLQITTVCTGDLAEFLEHPRIRALADTYTVVRTGTYFFDVTGKNVDKGTAIGVLQERFGIRPEETIVFGDSMNDVPMFSCSPHSYAVETAPEAVRSQATHTVAGPEQNGVATLLSSALL